MSEAVPVKVTPVMDALFTVTTAVAGLNVYPERLGATIYDPFAKPVKV